MPWTLLQDIPFIEFMNFPCCLNFLSFGVVLHSSQRGCLSRGTFLAMPLHSFLLVALEHIFWQRGSQRQHSILVSGSERRGAGALRRKSSISCLPQLHGAAPAFHHIFCSMCKNMSVLTFAGWTCYSQASLSSVTFCLAVFFFFCRLACRLYVLFTTNTEV